jgi:hypothetical protein
LDRITKISLVAGGRDVLVYTTISGAVGALVPFASMDDVEFMTTLEMVRSCSSLLSERKNQMIRPDDIAHANAKHFVGRTRSPSVPRILRARHGCD